MEDGELSFRRVLLEEILEIRDECLSGKYGTRYKAHLLARLWALREIVE